MHGNHRHQDSGQHHGRINSKRKMHSFSRLSTTSSQLQQKDNNNKNLKTNLGLKKHRQEQHQRPTIPFEKPDRILLIGEGDFSFARSLAEYHLCKYIAATCYDSKDQLFAKYPQAKGNVNLFLNTFRPGRSTKRGKKETESVTATEQTPVSPMQEEDKAEGHQLSSGDANDWENRSLIRITHSHKCKLIFSVDARKLGTAAGGGKDIRYGFSELVKLQNEKFGGMNSMQTSDHNGRNATPATATGGPWDIINFNFPHVGGISTDVNRQVRANQELLVSFFKACVPLLSSKVPAEMGVQHSKPEGEREEGRDSNQYNTDSEFSDSSSANAGTDNSNAEKAAGQKSKKRTVSKTRGVILVTIFEGEPYTLWNIKDLARHAGLRVVTSFQFPWKSYPGYTHARTLGVVKGRSGRTGGGWKGEDRKARTYVFEVNGENDNSPAMEIRKRRRGDSSDDDDDDDD